MAAKKKTVRKVSESAPNTSELTLLSKSNPKEVSDKIVKAVKDADGNMKIASADLGLNPNTVRKIVDSIDGLRERLVEETSYRPSYQTDISELISDNPFEACRVLLIELHNVAGNLTHAANAMEVHPATFKRWVAKLDAKYTIRDEIERIRSGHSPNKVKPR